MRLRTFYQLTILFPLIGLGLVAALHRGDADLMTGLAEGGRARWLYPRSATRGLLAYGAVAGWLLMELRRRRPTEFRPVLWRAPLLYLAALVVLLLPFVLVHGNAPELFSEQGGRLGLRLLVHLVIAFSYVALLGFVREQLQAGGVLETDEQAEGSRGA
ncbi:MAG TPA: hypothetical protein VKD72_11200 [Gemmataceae bacterium]|nr:hypothetical protein [Gemmataceae bacterium]